MARLFMDFWVKGMLGKAELMQSLAKINPILYHRLNVHTLKKYVDDVFSGSNTIPKGFKWNWEQEAMQWDPDSAETDARNPNERTIEEISKMASSIFKCLRFTWDSPGKNQAT